MSSRSPVDLDARQPMTDTRVLCLECRRWFKQLVGHLRVHGMTTDDYRAAHGLPTSFALISPTLKQAKAARARAQYPGNVRLREASHGDEWLSKFEAGSQAAREINLTRPGYLDAVRDAQTRAAQTRRSNSRKRYDRSAKALGYRDIADMLAHTWPLTDLEFGGLLGVSESNGGDIRSRYAVPRPAEEMAGAPRRALQYVRAIDRRYDDRARQAGYGGITQMLDLTRDLTHRELAARLGVSAQAASRLRSDPSMARLRPAGGAPIEATPGLLQRRGQRNKGSARPRNSQAQRKHWLARHERTARQLGYTCLEDMAKATIDLSTKDFGRLLDVSQDAASRLRRSFNHLPVPQGSSPKARVVTLMRYTEKARKLGYQDMTNLLQDTKTLSLRQLQQLLGISVSTAHRLRNDPAYTPLRTATPETG